mmetsp:Transcript_364/g.681  ORF Transcript_364/g.681 Transcript_364/m.681 type:complete len:86 (-) Transcript_364:1105-1362(-)
MTLITVYALYGDDLKIIFFPKAADDFFDGATLFCIAVYLVEIALACYADRGYVGSFFFWLDIFSTLTLVPDCGWIYSRLVEQEDF